MSWYSWTIFSVVLMLGEILTPGTLFSLFFAASALTLGLLTWLKVVTELWVQWLLFPVIAASLYLLFSPQRWRLTGGDSQHDRDQIVGNTVILNKKISPQAMGEVTYRGASWQAKNVGLTTIEIEDKPTIVAVHGLTLEVATTPLLTIKTSNYQLKWRRKL
jgi:inner membrane protein